jgi:hypothetical protein
MRITSPGPLGSNVKVVNRKKRNERKMILDTVTVDICVPDNITDEAAEAALEHLDKVHLARQFSDMGTGLLRGAITGVFVRPSVPGPTELDLEEKDLPIFVDDLDEKDLPVFEEVLEEELRKLGAVKDEPQFTHFDPEEVAGADTDR